MTNNYTITNYTRKQARKYGVTVKRSQTRGKKIDVFRHGKKVASVGAIGYGDYPTFMRKYGRAYASKKRRLYKIRHTRDRTRHGTPGFYADKLLW